MAGASRTELLQWLNELLRLNYTRVEQCGAGGAYLQVLDSIYGDIGPMARVEMQARRP
jgi:RP/EB family microtubule-associated protein